jgi:imidazolonepropionase-like amidohydrolase
MPMTLVAHWARLVMEGWLRRGFTTVRDTGGGEYGLRLAVERGWVEGPRLVYCGPAFTQTGGGADFRDPEADGHLCVCGAAAKSHGSKIVDGCDAVRAAVREEFRRGAGFIKILASGAVAAPSNALERIEFSRDEILAFVDETECHGSYLTAHVHPDAAARRCVELGVPFLEHASLITQSTAELAADRGVKIVPTLSIVWALARHGGDLGVPANFLEKVARVEGTMLQAAEHMKRAGITIGFGTDCLGQFDEYQTIEFVLRGEIWSPVEVLRQATSVNAEILRLDGLGRVEPGYVADLLVVDGNPLDDLALFDAHGTNLPVIVKGGRVVKNELARSALAI